MIAEIAANHRVTEMFLQIAQRLTGRAETKKQRNSFLAPLLESFAVSQLSREYSSCLVSVVDQSPVSVEPESPGRGPESAQAPSAASTPPHAHRLQA